MQRYLSTPIVELASTLDRVAASGDYSTRAEGAAVTQRDQPRRHSITGAGNPLTLSSAISPCLDGWLRSVAEYQAYALRGRTSEARYRVDGAGSDSDRQAVLAAGFDDHLVKPFNFPGLLRVVSRSA